MATNSNKREGKTLIRCDVYEMKYGFSVWQEIMKFYLKKDYYLILTINAKVLCIHVIEIHEDKIFQLDLFVYKVYFSVIATYCI